jgi:tetratricopeptide (TPR) repeat protein
MARSLRVICLGFLVAGTALNLPLAARSASAGELDRKDNVAGNEALGLYKEGRYEEAAKIFVKLSIAHPDMFVFVRNIGACYYYLRRIDPALSNLREYLVRKKNITAEDRAEVEGWINELEHLRSRVSAPPASLVVPPQPASPAPPAATQESPEPAPSIAPVAASGPGVPPVVFSPAQRSDSAYSPASQNGSQAANPHDQRGAGPATQYPPAGPGRSATQSQVSPAAGLGANVNVQPPVGDNNAAWIVGGIGVALVATGGVFSYLSQSAFSDSAKRYNPSRESTGKTYADIGAVAYGLGAAGVVTAVVMMAIGHRDASRSLALVPVFSTDAVGALVNYTY